MGSAKKKTPSANGWGLESGAFTSAPSPWASPSPSPWASSESSPCAALLVPLVTSHAIRFPLGECREQQECACSGTPCGQALQRRSFPET